MADIKNERAYCYARFSSFGPNAASQVDGDINAVYLILGAAYIPQCDSRGGVVAHEDGGLLVVLDCPLFWQE